MWNLVKKRTFCQKWRPLKKKGQNVSFRELKDEKVRVDSPAVKKNGPMTVPAIVKAYRRTVPGQNSRCKDKTLRFKARATLKQERDVQ